MVIRLAILALAALTSVAGCGGAPGLVATDLGSSGGVTFTGPLTPNQWQNGPATTPDDQNFGSLLNSYRDAVGVGRLGYDRRLNTTAQDYADKMHKEGFFAHKSTDGTLVQDRMRRNGYEPTAYAEILGKGQQSDRQVLTDWQKSPSHDAALRAGSLEEFGLGLAGTGGNTRWVLVMGTEARQ